MESESEPSSASKTQEEDQSKCKEAKELLKDLKQLAKDGLDCVDQQVEAEEEKLCRVLKIPRDKWIKDSATKTIDYVISTYEFLLSDMGKLVNNRTQLTPSEVLENASASRALRGILLGGTLELKGIILRTPHDVKLMNPTLENTTRVFELFSQTNVDHFAKQLNQMGYSVAAGVKYGMLGVVAEAGAAHRHKGMIDQEQQFNKQCTFHSRINCIIVPLASFQLNPHNLCLSQEVLKELQLVENNIRACHDDKLKHKECVTFFDKYGSHINIGVSHIGGMTTLQATYSSETESTTDTVTKVVCNALETYMSMSYSGLAGDAGANIKLNSTDIKGQMTADNTEDVLSKTNLSTRYIGGPNEVSSIPLWRFGLTANNRTWAVIDMSAAETDHVGIWTLIPKHREFTDAHALALHLKQAWQSTHGSHSDDVGTCITQLRLKIPTWISGLPTSTTYIACLDQLLKAVEDEEQEWMTRGNWVIELCRKSGFDAFLLKVVKMKDEYPKVDVPKIQYRLRKLVTAAGANQFEGRDEILEWAEKESTPTTATIRADDVTRLEQCKEIVRVLEQAHVMQRLEELAGRLKDKQPTYSDLKADFDKLWTSVELEVPNIPDLENSALRLLTTMVRSKKTVVAADLFCDHIQYIIQQHVTSSLPGKIVDEITGHFSEKKHSLMMVMLRDLAEKDNFESYKRYIEDSSTFTSQWLYDYTAEQMFTKKGNTSSTYGQIAKFHVQQIMRLVVKSVEHATDKLQFSDTNHAQIWTTSFCNMVKDEIDVPDTCLTYVNSRSIVDFENFQRIILNQLDTREAHIVQHFNGKTEQSVDWKGAPPYPQLFDKLWGCPKQCPLCGEPCAETTHDHYKQTQTCHTCLRHRPIGVNGKHWVASSVAAITACEGDEKLATGLFSGMCGSLVKSEGIHFWCTGCEVTPYNQSCKDYHPYLEYKTQFPEWKIAAEEREISKYWRWFMATYLPQLQDRYGGELSVPSQCSSVTKEEALDDLWNYRN